MPNRMKRAATSSDELSVEQSEDTVVVRFRCALDYEHATRLRLAVERVLRERRTGSVRLDYSGVTTFDATGLALMDDLESLGRDLSVPLEACNVPPKAEAFLSLAHGRHAEAATGQARPPGPVERLGERVVFVLHEMHDFTEFIGDFLIAFVRAVPRPRRWRLSELARQVEKGGSNAILLVIGLIFLTGIIMAFQASSSFGGMVAPIFVADTVTLFTTKRMAPLLTAIIVASRSGTGYASELGAMRVTHQMDALTVMGFDVVQFLVLPRVLALMLVTPMLIMIGNVAGITGGSLVGKWVLGVPFVAYFGEVHRSLQAQAIYSGALKGMGFGAVVGLIGCFRGLRVGDAAQSVGKQTTAAVVNALLVIIVFDAIFAAIFSLHGW